MQPHPAQVFNSTVPTGIPLTNTTRSRRFAFLPEYTTCRITRTLLNANRSTSFAFSDVAGRAWNRENFAFSTPIDPFSAFRVPPPFIVSVVCTATMRSRICLRPRSRDAVLAPGFTSLSSCSGCVACNHANTSAGNSARSRSYPGSSGEYSQPCAARYSQISVSNASSC
ncbi:MAG: hypothetical protein WAZ28_02000 [Microbacterium sp.]